MQGVARHKQGGNELEWSAAMEGIEQMALRRLVQAGCPLRRRAAACLELDELRRCRGGPVHSPGVRLSILGDVIEIPTAITLQIRK